jgi:hypothetical protein
MFFTTYISPQLPFSNVNIDPIRELTIISRILPFTRLNTYLYTYLPHPILLTYSYIIITLSHSYLNNRQNEFNERGHSQDTEGYGVGEEGWKGRVQGYSSSRARTR